MIEKTSEAEKKDSSKNSIALKDKVHTFLDVASYATLSTGWISLPALLKIVEDIAKRPVSSNRALTDKLPELRNTSPFRENAPSSKEELLQKLFNTKPGDTTPSSPENSSNESVAFVGLVRALSKQSGKAKSQNNQLALSELLNRAKQTDSNTTKKPNQDPLPAYILDSCLLTSLSPLGVLSTIRYNYIFETDLVEGPVQQVVALAPKETIEVVTQSTVRTSREDEYEEGRESETTNSEESKTSNELTDIISKTITHSVSNSVSGGGTGTIGVVSANISASESSSAVETSSVQSTNKAVREITIKASDRLKRSYKIRIKNVYDVTTSNSYRRTITNSNETNAINVAIHQALRKQTVISQHIASQLCWQCIIEEPGRNLRSGAYLPTIDDLRDEKAKNSKESPNTVGGGKASISIEVLGMSGSSAAGFLWPFITTLPAGHAYKEGSIITLLSVDVFNTNFNKRVADINSLRGIKAVDARRAFTDASSDPKKGLTSNNNGLVLSLMGRWLNNTGNVVDTPLQVKAVIEYEYEDSLLEQSRRSGDSDSSISALYNRLVERKKFEAKVISRPERDLREEERLEITARVLREKLGITDVSFYEYEYLNTLFDFEGLFYSLPDMLAASSKERLRDKDFLSEDQYLVADGTKAKFGESFHWDRRQCDGDRARDLILNASCAFVRVPIRLGKESDAIRWLRTMVEGEIYSDSRAACAVDALTNLYEDRNKARTGSVRDPQGDLADPGDVLASTRVVQNLDDCLKKAKPSLEELYPVVDRFKVSEPVDGYIYKVIKVK